MQSSKNDGPPIGGVNIIADHLLLGLLKIVDTTWSTHSVNFRFGPSIYDVHTEGKGQAQVDACGQGEGIKPMIFLWTS